MYCTEAVDSPLGTCLVCRIAHCLCLAQVQHSGRHRFPNATWQKIAPLFFRQLLISPTRSRQTGWLPSSALLVEPVFSSGARCMCRHAMFRQIRALSRSFHLVLWSRASPTAPWPLCQCRERRLEYYSAQRDRKVRAVTRCMRRTGDISIRSLFKCPYSGLT